MQPDAVLQIARNGAVVDSMQAHETKAAFESGRLLPTDHYLDPASNTWREASELLPKPAESDPSTKPHASNDFIVGAFLTGFVVIGVTVVAISQSPSSVASNAAAAAPANLVSPAERFRKAEQKLQELLPKFVAQTDKFEGITWYRHIERDALYKRFLDSDQGALLEVYVNSAGGRYLKSSYSGPRAIRYQYVLFIVDGVKYEGTRGAPSEDKDTEFTDKGAVESICHLHEEDRKFLSVLAVAARSGKPVSCRLTSLQSNIVYDWDPSPDELRVLADCVELADALREKRQASAAVGTGR